MKRSSGNGKRRVWAVVASAAVAAVGTQSAVGGEITSTWSGNSGNWTDPTQWSTNPNYPNNGTPSGTAYDAVINAPGAMPYTVTLANSITTDSVTLDSPNATLLQTGGVFTTTSLNVMAGTYSFMAGFGQFLSTVTNTGTINVNSGGTLHFSPTTFDNTNGTIEIGPGSEVQINPDSITPSQLGNIVNNGTVLLGGEIENAGNTLTFGGSTGTWELGGIIQGGVVNLPASTVLEGLDLESVALACDLTESLDHTGIGIDQVTISGHHAINLTGSGSALSVAAGPNASETLSNLTVNLGGSTANALGGYLYLGPLGSGLTLDTTAIVNGWGSIGIEYGGGGQNPLIVNQGTVSANVSGKTLTIFPSLFENTGVLQVANGGVLAISPAASTSWTNNGTLSVDSVSTISVNQNLAFADGSAFDATLGSNGMSGILSITGSLDLSHDEFLNLSLAPGAVFSTPYEIASYTGALTGTFENVTPGFVVDYSQPGEILVVAVPEPTDLTLIVCAGFAVLTRRRRAIVMPTT